MSLDRLQPFQMRSFCHSLDYFFYLSILCLSSDTLPYNFSFCPFMLTCFLFVHCHLEDPKFYSHRLGYIFDIISWRILCFHHYGNFLLLAYLRIFPFYLLLSWTLFYVETKLLCNYSNLFLWVGLSSSWNQEN